MSCFIQLGGDEILKGVSSCEVSLECDAFIYYDRKYLGYYFLK